MFANIAQIFKPANKDLRHRIIFTLVVLGIFCIGTNITVPWASTITKEMGFLELLDLMSGGALQQFSIFALGVTPYITASIITQLLQMDIIPYFSELKDQGYVGRQKINKITRYLGIIFAFVQGYVISIAFLGSNNTLDIMKTTLVLTAGTSLLMWLGDQITQKGLGNGLSLIIMAGIIESLPAMFKTAFNGLITSGTYALPLGITLFSVFVIIYILIIVGVIWIQLAERRIPIQYANRSNTVIASEKSFLPIKINAAGVMPVIFASTLLALPATIVNFIGNESAINFVNKWITYTSFTGFILYVLLIFFFGYFYTFMSMNPDEMSKNLNKNGGYIPGVRPGEATSKYIGNVLSKMTIVGSIFLVIIAGLPIIFSKFSGLGNSVTLGGTGLLIVVGVAIETYKQLESSIVSRSFKRSRKRI